MKKDFFKREGWHSVIAAAAIVACVLSIVFVTSYYNNRKEARREIENCKFKLRDNAGARRTYVATAPEITQNKHLRVVIDSLTHVNDSLVRKNPKEFEKNQRLISRLIWIANHNDSVANARLAEFDSVQNQLLREIEKNQAKLK
jgi:negative regulator of sigma E activity